MTSKLLRPEGLPWNVPVPVKRSSFIPVLSQHEKFNVETDLCSIGSFAVQKKVINPNELLWCDQQDGLGFTARKRFGAGRGGTYQNRYLKGVGRTILATNWSDSTDIDHNTGHLMTSGAIREYLVSEFLIAKGYGDVIVPVEGLLIRNRSKKLREHLRAELEDLPREYRRSIQIDSRLQGMSVKQADFMRYSNVLSALYRLDVERPDSAGRTLELLKLMRDACNVSRAPSVGVPSELGSSIAAALERGWNRFENAWRAGVSWGSVYNNFAIDGRFIDLESPCILGIPLVGITMKGVHERCTYPSSFSSTGFFEVLGFVRESRMAIRRISAFLIALRRLTPRRDPVRDVFEAVVAGLRIAIPTDHWVWSNREVAVRLIARLGELDLTHHSRKRMQQTIRNVTNAELQLRYDGVGEFTVNAHPIKLARNDLRSRPSLHLLDGALVGKLDQARAITELLDRLESIGDRDCLLAEIPAAAAEIRQIATSS